MKTNHCVIFGGHVVLILVVLILMVIIDESKQTSIEAEAFDFDSMNIVYPDDRYNYEKVCMDGVEYYRIGRGAAPVVDKETLTFKLCGE